MAEDQHRDPDGGADQPASRADPVNPYIAGNPVSGPAMFYGREDVFEFIRRNLIGQHRDTPIVLRGERRTGKTSVLYQMHRYLGPAYCCVSVDLHGLSLDGLGDLLHVIAALVSMVLRSDYGVDIAPPDRSAFRADPRSTFESVFLDSVLAALGEKHLLLMLDEVILIDEKIQAGQLEPEVFSYMRHLMQHYPQLNFIFSLGSGLEEMQKEYAFLFSPAQQHRISFLEEKAARTLITEPVRGYFEVSRDAVDVILGIASCHPYYTQLVCHGLFNRWRQSRKPMMAAEDVCAILDVAVERGSANLAYVWQDSAPREKAVLAAMASAMQTGRDSVSGREIRAAWRKACGQLPERQLSAALRSLASREIITGIEAYAFVVDLQRLWLNKHRRLDWVRDELAESIEQWAKETQTHRTRYLAAVLLVAILTGGLALAARTYWAPSKVAQNNLAQSIYPLLPRDLGETNAGCSAAAPPPKWSLPGLVIWLHCETPGLAGGSVFAYLLSGVNDYNKSLQNLNNALGFRSSGAKKGCPPPTGFDGVEVYDNGLPSASRDTLECGILSMGVGQASPTYVWEYPAYHAIVIAQSAPGSSISVLAAWLNPPPNPQARQPSIGA